MRLSIGECVIRDWSLADAPAIARHANNPKVAAQLRDGFPHPYGVEDATGFLQRVCATEPRMVFAIATPDEAVGSIGLMPGEDVHRFCAEMGYWLAEPFWGRGIVTRAIEALTEWAFDELGLHRIHADHYADNAASARALEKAGYTLEGRALASAVKLGVVKDQLIYARTRPGVHEGLRIR